jgi:FecR protein.
MLDKPRLETLLNAYFDCALTPEEKTELERMLLCSARAREIFREHAEHHGLLREWALRQQGSRLANVCPLPPMEDDPKILPFPRRLSLWVGIGLAACVALALLVLQLRPPAEKPVFSKSEPVADSEAPWNKVALLAGAVDVEWAEDSITPAMGEAIPKGWLKIKRGILRLDFYSGVRVVVEGPAELQLLSEGEARLDQGKLTAYVRPPAIGFTVHNREFTVVDRGTEFGMNVTGPDRCEVHVFKGEVALQGGIIKDGEKLLFAGDGVSVRDGKWTTISPDRHRFVDPEFLRSMSYRKLDAKYALWKEKSEKFRHTPGLGIYFDFEDIDFDHQILGNRSLAAERAGDGVIIGCEPSVGRWPKKGALGFARTSDRVRFRMDGETSSLTLLAWVRVDGLPLQHNQLFSMSPDAAGEVHWKLNQHGQMQTSVRVEGKRGDENWDILDSPPVITEKDFGYWLCLATVFDGENGVLKHYLNGKEVASGPWKRIVPIKLGVADLGNLAMPSAEQPKSSHWIRNFGGRIDEFALVTRALSAEEIREFAEMPEFLHAQLDLPVTHGVGPAIPK